MEKEKGTKAKMKKTHLCNNCGKPNPKLSNEFGFFCNQICFGEWQHKDKLKMMNVSWVNSSSSRYDKRPRKGRCMFCEALLMHNIENIGYAATNTDKPFIIEHTDGKTYTIALPSSIPLLSKLARRLGKSFTRKIIIALDNLAYAMRILSRLPRDKVDVYVILHLWDYEIPFLNLILRIFRPTVIMWFGGSLRQYEQWGKLKYYIFVSVYRLSLRLASLTLISLDPEQEYYLFKVLKLPRNKIVNFKEYIVDDKLFRRLDRDASAKKVGFSRDEINIIMVSRIESTQRIDSCKDYEKDPFTALEIFRCLAQKEPKVKLHVFGRGQGMEEFKRRVNQYNLQDKVKIYGWVERELLPEYYSAADLTFYPHPFITVNDGQANHESILCGTPVIYFKRCSNAPTEHLEGFSVSRDNLEQAAHEILLRITDEAYWDMKRRGTKLVPREWTIEFFGKKMANLLKYVVRKHRK